jgi:hypothetical protein
MLTILKSKPSYIPQVIDLPENKSLQIVVHSIAPLVNDDEKFFPIENYNGLEPGQLDVECLNASYFDDHINMSLPTYACSSIMNPKGNCTIDIKYDVHNLNGHYYDGKIHKKYSAKVNEAGRNLAKNIFTPTESDYKSFLRSTKKPKLTSSGLFGLFPKVENPYWDFDDNYNIYKVSSSYSTQLVCKFPGKIPNHIRDIVLKAKQYYTDVHMVWDAQNTWEITKHSHGSIPSSEITPEYDPIVFGEKNGKFYYLACFNVTPRESTILGEFIG